MTTPPPNEYTLYEATIHKQYRAAPWVNTYKIQAATLDDAETLALAFVDAEQHLHFSPISFTRLLVSSVPDPNRANGRETSLNRRGLADLGSNLLAPLTTCLHVKFGTAGLTSGKKLYRGCIQRQTVGPDGPNGIGFDDLPGAAAYYQPLLLPFVGAYGNSNAYKFVVGKHPKAVTDASVSGVTTMALHRGWYQKGKYRALYAPGQSTK